MTLGLVGYVRVPPAAWLPTVQEQERALHAWARAAHHRVTSVARDLHGVTGMVERRAGLREVFAAVGGGRADGLLVYALDVLDARTAAQEAVLGLVWGKGGEVFTCATGRVDPRWPGDELRAAAREAVHALVGTGQPATGERPRARPARRGGGRGGHAAGAPALDTRVDTMSEGALRAPTRRAPAVVAPAVPHYRAVGGGAPALGYRAEAGQRVVEPREQATLVRILELHRLGLSLRSIAGTLAAEGHRPKRSERWHPENLRRILSRLEAGGL